MNDKIKELNLIKVKNPKLTDIVDKKIKALSQNKIYKNDN